MSGHNRPGESLTRVADTVWGMVERAQREPSKLEARLEACEWTTKGRVPGGRGPVGGRAVDQLKDVDYDHFS